MARLDWGRDDQLSFADQEEYYYALGLLCNSDWFSIVYEPNSITNSWTDAFRIQCARCPVELPPAFKDALRTQRRINNNEYVENLYINHKFDYDGGKYITGDYNKVRTTVPKEYIADFDEGYDQ